MERLLSPSIVYSAVHMTRHVHDMGTSEMVKALAIELGADLVGKIEAILIFPFQTDEGRSARVGKTLSVVSGAGSSLSMGQEEKRRHRAMKMRINMCFMLFYNPPAPASFSHPYTLKTSQREARVYRSTFSTMELVRLTPRLEEAPSKRYP